MESEEQLDITGRLAAWSRGDDQALRDVIPLVYDDLRLIAHRHLGRLPRATSVQSGTLVHEAFLKLTHARGIRCNNRAHFFALCSQMIRRILTDYARKQRSAKRDETRQQPMVFGKLVAQAIAQPQVIRCGIGQRTHRSSPGHGRAIDRSVAKSTFA